MNAPDRKPPRPGLAEAPRHGEDFFAWSRDQAERLRARRPDRLDWENLAEEIESLGKSQRSAIRSRLAVLLVHLLKWRHQPEKRKTGWRATIATQRLEILDELQDSPSLKSFPAEVLASRYAVARLGAAAETGPPEDAFPAACPFTIDEVLDPDFLPAAPAA